MRITGAPFALVALLAVAVAWLQNPHQITAAEAVRVAEHAFAASGLPDAQVGDVPERGVHTTEGGDRVDVWRTIAALEAGRVELWLAQLDGRSVFLDDRAPDGASHLLTEAQFRRLEGYDENPAVSRQLRRNFAATVAAVLIAGVGAAISARSNPPDGAPGRPPNRPLHARPLRVRPLLAPQENA